MPEELGKARCSGSRAARRLLAESGRKGDQGGGEATHHKAGEEAEENQADAVRLEQEGKQDTLWSLTIQVQANWLPKLVNPQMRSQSNMR